MLERLVNWRGKRLGTQWHEAPATGSEAEQARQRQARVDAAVLRRYERELRDVPVVPGDDQIDMDSPPPPPVPQVVDGSLLTAWFLFTCFGAVSGLSTILSALDGEWFGMVVCGWVTGLCAYLLRPAMDWVLRR